MRASQQSYSAEASLPDAAFQNFLLDLATQLSASASILERIDSFCRAMRAYFDASVACYWETSEPASLQVAGWAGRTQRPPRPQPLTPESNLAAFDALRSVKARVLPALHRPDAAKVWGYPARAALIVPVVPGSDSPGLLALFHDNNPQFFTEAMAAQAAVAAALAGAALEAGRYAVSSQQHRERAENLMSLALELQPSMRLPDFARRFTLHAMSMLRARTGLLAIARSGRLDLVFSQWASPAPSGILQRGLEIALYGLAGSHPGAIIAGTGAQLLGRELAASLAWEDIVLVRLRTSAGELLGALCLANRGRELTPADRNLLAALAGHASVTMENSGLLSRIEQSRKQWIEVFDAITDFIAVHDEQNNLVRINRSLAAFIGASPTELIGVNMRQLVPFLGSAGEESCPYCRPSRAGDEEEYIHTQQDRVYLVSTSRIPGTPEEGVRTIHVLKDITDRREAERRYRELFDNIQEGLFFATPDGRFLEVNNALVRMLGYLSREQLLEADLARQVFVHAEDWRRFSDTIERSGILRNYEVMMRRKDSSIIHTLQNILAVRNAQGKVVQYRGLMLDVTEQKTYQAQLQRERDFNRKILNNTASMILVLDTAGLVTYANRRCFENGYTEPDLLGRPLPDLVPPGSRRKLAEALEHALHGRLMDNFEIPVLRPDGKTGQFSVNLSPMRGEQGTVDSIVTVMTDITDSASLQAKLVHAEKMATVGNLVSGVAHEVNNPLTAILGFTDLLLENPEIPDSAKSDLQVVLQEAQRTRVIVQNLLSFARQAPAQRQPVQLTSVLRHTLKLRSYDFISHGVDVEERFDPRLPEIVGDPHQLQQVFLNILNNAYDAVREAGRPGRIEIETARRGDCVEVSIRDNGTGISQPDKIFDPFFTTKEVGKGTGLGLSICYGIVREHGGEILCENNTGAPGCTFVVRLPLAAPKETVLRAEVGS
ncbi:MAG TPA: PAS domain S-box protein [Candidatus Acidoferrales bacterium]|nr:PAS domain S-box protein [Candidatus Acidoferrales bacterium]